MEYTKFGSLIVEIPTIETLKAETGKSETSCCQQQTRHKDYIIMSI